MHESPGSLSREPRREAHFVYLVPSLAHAHARAARVRVLQPHIGARTSEVRTRAATGGDSDALTISRLISRTCG